MKKAASKIRLYSFGIIGILILLVFIVWFATALLLQISGLAEVNGSVFFVNRLILWLSLLLLLLYAKNVEKQKLCLWPEQRYAWWFYLFSPLIILIALFIGNVTISKIISWAAHGGASEKFLEYVILFKNNVPLLIFTVATAAITEELIFRGYIQPRLEAIFKSPFIAIVATSLLFALVHLSYGTWAQFIVPFFIGLVFSYFYWKYKNIKILIICHFLWDLLGLLAAIKFL